VRAADENVALVHHDGVDTALSPKQGTAATHADE